MIRTVLAALAVLLALCGGARAAERITDFLSEVRVAAGGGLTVRESITVQVERASIRHGILRDFPTTYTDRGGRSARVGFRVLSVQRDGANEPYEVASIEAGKRVKIGRPDALVPVGQHRYVITYTTDRQIRFFADYDELYWNATGNEWRFPIDHASAIVSLPGAARILQSAAYTGAIGSTAHAARITQISDTQIRFETTAPLGVRQGLTVAVGFAKGAVAPPSRLFAALRDQAAGLAAIAGFAAVLIYYLVAWSRVGRDPDRGVIIPLFSAPAELSPAAIRYVDRMGYDNKTYAAALVDMAVKGLVTISEADGAYTLTRTASAEASARLSGDERAIAAALGLGGAGDKAQLKRANRSAVQGSVWGLRAWLRQNARWPYFRTNRIWAVGGLLILASAGAAVAALADRQDAAEALVALALWTAAFGVLLQAAWRYGRDALRHPGVHFRSLFRALFASVLAVALAGVGLLFSGGVTKALGMPATVALCAGGGLFFLFRGLLTAPTVAGARLLDQIEGFRMFLETAERDRLEALHPPEITPEVFERFLPYAMALDCENEWARRFEAEAAAAGWSAGVSDGGYTPGWYSGSSGWSGIDNFAGDLGPSLASATAAASASESSGSGGGGSSGGGGGGGGGGGW